MPGLYRFFRHRPLCRRWHTFTPSALGCASVCGHIGTSSESPLDLFTRALERGSACKSPRPFLIRAGHCSLKGGRQRAHESVNSQLTPRLGAHAIILGCSEDLPASVDVLSPSILIRWGPESELKGGREMTPAGALKLPLPWWKWALGGPEDGTPGGLILGRRPRPPLPRCPLQDPGCSRCQGCSRRAPGAQRPPSSFKGDSA